MSEFHFTDAEKEQIQGATFNAMSDTLRQLYPLFEKVCGERIAKLEAENERLSAPVSDEEMQEHAVHAVDLVQPHRREPALLKYSANSLIRARKESK